MKKLTLILYFFWSFYAIASIQDTSKILGIKVDLGGPNLRNNISLDYIHIYKRFQWQSTIGLEGIYLIEYWTGEINQQPWLIPKSSKSFERGPNPYVKTALFYRFPLWKNQLGISMGTSLFFNVKYLFFDKSKYIWDSDNSVVIAGLPLRLDFKNLFFIGFTLDFRLKNRMSYNFQNNERMNNWNWSFYASFQIATIIPLKIWKK